jgi:hypothetical protein
MRKFLLAATAVAVLITAGFAADRAQARPPASLASPGAATGVAPRIERVAVICGTGGCEPIHVRRVQPPLRRFGVKTLPPYVPPAPAPQPSLLSRLLSFHL